LKMEAVRSYETSADFYQTTWHYIPKDRTFHCHFFENLTSNLKRKLCPFWCTIMVELKSSVFWDIMLRSPLKVNRCFGGTCRLHLQGRRICQARRLRLLSCSLLAWLILQLWRWRKHVPLKCWLTFNRLRDVEPFVIILAWWFEWPHFMSNRNFIGFKDVNFYIILSANKLIMKRLAITFNIWNNMG
jgi:hypothetical protein